MTRVILLPVILIATLVYHFSAAEGPRADVEIVTNDALPGSMRVGRYLAAEQRLFDAFCAIGGDTLVLVWEIRTPAEEWTARITYGDATSAWGSEISIDHDKLASYPQFRRVIVAVPPGTEAQSVSMTMRTPHFEAHSGSVTNYKTLDIK